MTLNYGINPDGSTFAIADDYEVAVAQGQIEGWASMRKFGMNDDVDTSGFADVWPAGVVRVLPASAGVVTVVSSSINDDLGSSGQETIRVEGLDADFVEITEDFTMDGTTPVVGSTSFLRINRMYGLTGGAVEVNEGNISASIGGVVQGYIEANEGQTHQCMYTVPADKDLLINAYHVGVGRMSGNADAHMMCQIKLLGGTWRSVSDVYVYNGGNFTNDSAIITVPAKSEVRIQIASTSATQAFGIFSGYIIDHV